MPVSQETSNTATPQGWPTPPQGPPTPTSPRRGLSPLTIVFIIIIIGIAGALWLLSRPHGGQEVVIAVAKRDIAAFTYIHEGDIGLTIRAGNPEDSWNTLPSGPLLLLAPLKSGEIIHPSDVLQMAGVNMPQQPMIMSLQLINGTEAQFQPGQQVIILGVSNNRLKISGIFLSLAQNGHQAIVAISNADFLRFGSELGSTKVVLARSLQ